MKAEIEKEQLKKAFYAGYGKSVEDHAFPSFNSLEKDFEKWYKSLSKAPEKEEEKKCSPLEHESGLTHSGQCLICGEKSF